MATAGSFGRCGFRGLYFLLCHPLIEVGTEDAKNPAHAKRG